MTAADWAERLSTARPLLDRASTAELVADVLRENVIDGSLPPGTRLSEETIGNLLGVSRNTLREAFRLLSYENLLVHELHRGVFVRKLAAADVADIYAMRRILETASVRAAGAATSPTWKTTPRRLRAGRDETARVLRNGGGATAGRLRRPFALAPHRSEEAHPRRLT
ncbi:GntR family transcriptional regulator [Microbispora rosea]|uniref:GntR family transcriptional regulator n=1 Tax=Microbispora rosea TaxID=58117 RepID=UPI003445AD40